MRGNSRFCLARARCSAPRPLGAQGTYQQTMPLDPANIDRTANACTDFYQFANGGWLKSNPLPAAYSRWGSFEELGEKNQANLTKILQAAASTRRRERRATQDDRHLLLNCMDSAAAERRAPTPLKGAASRIPKIDDRKTSLKKSREIQIERHSRPLWIRRNSGHQEQHLGNRRRTQGGIGLPDRDYYFKTDRSRGDPEELRRAHSAHARSSAELPQQRLPPMHSA